MKQEYPLMIIEDNDDKVNPSYCNGLNDGIKKQKRNHIHVIAQDIEQLRKHYRGKFTRETVLKNRLEKYGKLPRKQKKELKKLERPFIMDEFHFITNPYVEKSELYSRRHEVGI